MYSVCDADLHAAAPLLARLWTSNLPISGDAHDKLRWFYREGPHGAGRAFLLRATEEPVGCAGFAPRTLVHHGQSMQVALLADLAIEPRFRSALPALTLLRFIHSEVRQRFVLGYGFPNDKAAPVFRRAGYERLGDMYRYVRVLRSRRYLRGPLGNRLSWPVATTVDAGLAAVSRWRAARVGSYRLVWPRRFDSRFDVLWREVCDRMPLACQRDASLLGWRFARVRHGIAALVDRDEHRLCGYAVVQGAEDGSIDVLDLLARSDRDLDALLALLLRDLCRRGCVAVRCRFLGDSRVIGALEHHGFLRRGTPRAVMVAWGQHAAERVVPHSLDGWYLTDLDEDN